MLLCSLVVGAGSQAGEEGAAGQAPVEEGRRLAMTAARAAVRSLVDTKHGSEYLMT